MRFQKAQKAKAHLRLALVGPSGSGKTYTGLVFARELGDRIAVIDTERGSASKYAGDVADFDVLELEDFAPRQYVSALRAAAGDGYPVVLIDSLTHAWSGKGGALEMVDKAASRSRGNSYVAWRDVTPEQQSMVDAILRYPGHVIVTMRTKTKYVLEVNDKGKNVPVKVGLQPIQRDGIEYEFDVVADIDTDHKMIVSKSRCPALDGVVVVRPGADVARDLKVWLSDGVERKRPESRQPIASAEDSVSRSDEQPTARAPTQLGECATELDLRRWCAERAAAVLEAHGDKAVRAIVARAEAIGVPESVVRGWLPEDAA